MSRHVCLSALVLAFAASAAAAQEPQTTYDQCLAKAETDTAMEACAKSELEQQDAQLKRLEGELAAKQGANKAAFEAAQEAWRRFRDAQCSWDRANARQGESAEFTEIDCRIGLTEARSGELDARLNPAPDTQTEK